MRARHKNSRTGTVGSKQRGLYRPSLSERSGVHNYYSAGMRGMYVILHGPSGGTRVFPPLGGMGGGEE